MAGDQTDRPGWLTSPCPSWCQRVHAESDHPEDRLHQSATQVVPAIIRESVLPEHAPAVDELLVALVAPVDDVDTWVRISVAEGPGSMVVELASMHRLLKAVVATTAQTSS